MNAEDLHVSVLLEEAVAGLQPRSGGVYIDATCGLGGHSEAVLEASGPDGRVMAIDRDPKALEYAQQRLSRFGSRAKLVEGDFSDIESLAKDHAHHPADGIIADLGVSSLQLDDASRGFSFRAAAPLDMRMGQRVGATAAALLESTDESQLADLLREYGEVPKARRVARSILQARDEGQLETTKDLAKAVERVLRPHRKQKTHPATRVFQAIRIAVNRELEELDTFLQAVPNVLRPGGRVSVISFHSLEDRKVKRAFRDPPAPPVPRGFPVEPERPRGPFEAINRKPIVPTEGEVERNPRARSAKLRVAERRADQRRSA